jgi:hypothetical protein
VFERGDDVSMTFLMGAIVGSGIAILAGRAPANRLLQVVQKRISKRRP